MFAPPVAKKTAAQKAPAKQRAAVPAPPNAVQASSAPSHVAAIGNAPPPETAALVVQDLQARGHLSTPDDAAEVEAHETARKVARPLGAANARAVFQGTAALAPTERTYFEGALGVGLGGVRLYAGAEGERFTAGVDALAATRGNAIYFSPRAPSLSSGDGGLLLAHELAHVAQAARGRIPSSRIMREPLSEVVARLANDWSVLGSQPDPVTAATVGHFLVDFDKMDATLIAESTTTLEPGPTGEQTFFVRHPTKGVVARVLVKEVTYGSSSSMNYLFKYAPKGGGSTAGKSPGATVSPPGAGGAPSSTAPGGGGAAKAPPAPTTTTTPAGPVVAAPAVAPANLSDLQARLKILEIAMKRTTDRYQNKDGWEQPLIAEGFKNLAALRGSLTGSADDVALIEDAEGIVERLEPTLLTILDKWKEVQAAPDLKDVQGAYGNEIAAVQRAYFTAHSKLLTNGQVTAFNEAEQKAAALPRALIEVNLKRFETIPQHYTMMEPTRKWIAEWVVSVRGDLDALEKLVADLNVARQANAPNVAALEAAVLEKGELVQLSIEAIGFWDQARQAFEYLAGQKNYIYQAYSSISHLVQRCRTMKDLAEGGKLADLRAAVDRYRNDQDIKTFYRGLPMIAAGSRFLVILGITLIATMVTAGIAGLVAGGAATGGAAAGATATGITARTALAFAGTAALEALTFTAVSTSLNAALLGQKVTPKSFVHELLWNIGLFGVLKGLSVGVGRGMTALELPKLTGAVSAGLSMPLLHYYGMLRFRLEEGRAMTQAEIQMADAQSLIMMTGMSLGSAVVQRWTGKNKASELAKFERDYGFRFKEIENGRQMLIEEVAELIRTNRGDDKVALDDIRDRGQKLEDIFKTVVKEIEAKVDLVKLRAELESLGVEIADDASKGGLALALGVDVATGLRRAGNSDRAYSYAWNKTNQMESRLRALRGATVTKETDPLTGQKTLTLKFGNDPPIIFQERPDPIYSEVEVEVDPADPLVVKLIADLKLTDPVAIRTLVRAIMAELGRGPKQGMSSAIGKVRKVIKTKSTVTTGATPESVLLDMHAKGIKASSAEPALIALAEKLVKDGVADSAAWLEQKSAPQRLGLLGERLGLDLAPKPTGVGARILTNVKVVGDFFVDAAGTTPRTMTSGRPATGVEITEVDYMGVSGTGADIVVENVANVKAAPSLGGPASAQNMNAISAVRGFIAGKLAVIKDGQTSYYARISSIKGVDPAGAAVDFSAATTSEAKTGIGAKTIGPKNAGGYDASLPYTKSEIETVVELMREIQAKRSSDY